MQKYLSSLTMNSTRLHVDKKTRPFNSRASRQWLKHLGLVFQRDVKQPHVLDGGVLEVQRQDLDVLCAHGALQRCAQLTWGSVMWRSEVPVLRVQDLALGLRSCIFYTH